MSTCRFQSGGAFWYDVMLQEGADLRIVSPQWPICREQPAWTVSVYMRLIYKRKLQHQKVVKWSPAGAPADLGNRKSSLFCFSSLRGARRQLNVNTDACRVYSLLRLYILTSVGKSEHFQRSVKGQTDDYFNGQVSIKTKPINFQTSVYSAALHPLLPACCAKLLPWC